MNYYISDMNSQNRINSIVFRPDTWDDYSFRTTFQATYVDSQGVSKNLGSVKIGMQDVDVEEGVFYTKEFIPSHFECLPKDFFSLWQSAESYQKLREIVEETGCNVFKDLRDIAFDLKLCKQYWSEPILQNSLTRSVNLTTIENQFHRITLGQAKLTKYNFAYEIGKINSGIKLTFDVIPNSLPPTNIHVLIGGNGIGKTTLIKDMVEGILSNDQDSVKGRFSYNYSDSIIHSAQFANVICVAFSPFDDFSLFEKYEKKADSSFEKYERFSYIGTKKKYHFGDGNRQEVKNLLDDIEDNFVSSLKSCLGNLTKREDLADVIGILENDPIFFNYRIGELIIGNDASIDYNDMTLFRKIFSSMSSGHKVVLSTIVRCIDKMVEKTVLFLDEPENHLHPPLVSSLIRALSTVLMKRNGVALISTHSPIVLQETPKSCVWILARNGDIWNASRPRFETFGENIGSLTNDVFRYEINNSGFHALLRNSVAKCDSYDEVLDMYDNQLGDEARGLVCALFSQKARGEL